MYSFHRTGCFFGPSKAKLRRLLRFQGLRDFRDSVWWSFDLVLELVLLGKVSRTDSLVGTRELGRRLHGGLFAVRSDANAAPGFDDSVEIVLADSDSASEPTSCESAGMNQPVDGIAGKLQLVGGLLNG